MRGAISKVFANARAGVRGFVTPGPRMVDEAECVASVLLAIAFGHLLGAHNVSWAAFSGYMVMRGHAAHTLRRGALRIVGTAAGGALAVMFLSTAGVGVPGVVGALAAVTALTLYGALTMRHSYAWLFVGLTFAMIVLDKVERPDAALSTFAATRMIEVVAGTLACVLVSLASTWSLRRYWPAPAPPPVATAGWRPDAARHAGQGALAVAAIPLIFLVTPLPQLAQASVAIMAVMVAPLDAIAVSGLWPVTRRIALRVAGCGAGACVAALVLASSQGSALAMIAGVAFAVVLGRHIENSGRGHAYAGVQFTLAALVTLVPDSYAAPDTEAGWQRLIATLLGLCILEPVLVLWHLLAPRGAARARSSRAAPESLE